MFRDLFRVMEQVSRDKGIPKEYLIDAIESAFLTAARKKWGHLGELEAQFNEDSGEIELFQFKTVADPVQDPNIEMTVSEAHALDPDAQLGDSLGVKMDPSVFGRIAAQTAKQVIIQKVREAERHVVSEEYKNRLGEIVTGIVRRMERGSLIVDLGRTEAIVPREEQVSTERYRPGERVQGLFVRLDKEGKGPVVVLSRKTPEFVKALFAMEVPEMHDGVVEIRAVAREAGVRTKIAVYSRDHDVDPVGACVGMKGSRVQNVVAELKGEKIDIVTWDEDPARFVCNAIAPAEVAKVIIRDREHSMEVVVPDDQLSLAIGRRGQNVRLAAQLTAWNIDVFSETKIEAIAARARKVLSEVLGVDDSTSMVLYSHSFRSFEDIASATDEEFAQVPGIGEENLNKIKVLAKQAVADGKSTDQMMMKLLRAEEEVARKEAELAAKQAAERAAEQAAKAAEEETVLEEEAEPAELESKTEEV
ncbi:MAG: transcription termination/antitermination protein NusA [Deltaproteobacteria bacterium CG11_big_fil_rev_8_21_14_0_20_42_23]|nr:MAG: transcription termination/antitermination protein NusA [Deltaproteobacteria bacterium CG11_big_fil_rev_8_21_14_0_20_42_23]PJC65258.1 MAG: transcription termination/antitermination protein NusA [Deltaproteobacteria bacterium CG_4_9_14_0_2_um_filter_42_21]